MFTLFELMAHPNLEIYAPVWEHHGEQFKLVFIAFVIVACWAMLSLLTGVISENMLQKSQARKEELNVENEKKRKRFLERVGVLFKEIDVNGDGDMSRDEFQEALPKIVALMEEEEVTVSTADLCSVFDTIDFDGSGSIDMEEFLNGMVYLSADLRAIHDVQVQYMVLKDHMKILHRINTIQQKYDEQVRGLQRTVRTKHSRPHAPRVFRSPPPFFVRACEAGAAVDFAYRGFRAGYNGARHDAE